VMRRATASSSSERCRRRRGCAATARRASPLTVVRARCASPVGHSAFDVDAGAPGRRAPRRLGPREPSAAADSAGTSPSSRSRRTDLEHAPAEHRGDAAPLVDVHASAVAVLGGLETCGATRRRSPGLRSGRPRSTRTFASSWFVHATWRLRVGLRRSASGQLRDDRRHVRRRSPGGARCRGGEQVEEALQKLARLGPRAQHGHVSEDREALRREIRPVP
jgi:hypothetical protein